MNNMTTKENKDKKVMLLPGDLIISKEENVIWTLLGSCISIIFYNRRTQLSAVCHAQLPSKDEKYSCKDSCPNPCGKNEKDHDFKYVTCSFKYMLNLFQKSEIQKSEIEVSLFGGANMFNFNTDTLKVGARNIEMAKNLINKSHLRIINESIGGTQSRTITYYSKTGKIELTINPSTTQY